LSSAQSIDVTRIPEEIDRLAIEERRWHGETKRDRACVDGVYRIVDRVVGLDGDGPATAEQVERIGVELEALDRALALPFVECQIPVDLSEAQGEALRIASEIPEAQRKLADEPRALAILEALRGALEAFMGGMLGPKAIEPLALLGRRDERVRALAVFLTRCLELQWRRK
jgi:hypothetical protein